MQRQIDMKRQIDRYEKDIENRIKKIESLKKLDRQIVKNDSQYV